MRGSGVAIVLLLAAAAAAGCGSGSDDGSGEVATVLGQLKSLRKGEIVIQGITSPRVIGPYVFKPGGYALRFEQPGAPKSNRGRLVVALESKPRTRAQPYQLLVNSDRRSGTKGVSVSGKLYVHVVRAPGDYVLRFTPRHR